MRSLPERIVHTALFEILAVAIVTPSMSALTHAPLQDTGVLSVLISIGATISNYVWTILFDRLVPTRQRGVWVRAAQAVGLELIVSSFTIPLVMIFTGATLLTAVMIDIAAIGFFIVFAMAYNAVFDAVMLRLLAPPKPAGSRVNSSGGSPS